MNDEIEVRIARTEREYERITHAAFIARTHLKSLSTDSSHRRAVWPLKLKSVVSPPDARQHVRALRARPKLAELHTWA